MNLQQESKRDLTPLPLYDVASVVSPANGAITGGNEAQRNPVQVHGIDTGYGLDQNHGR